MVTQLMKQVLMPFLASTFLLFQGCLLTGCAGMGPKNLDQALEVVEQAQAIAAAHGVSWYADIEVDGEPNLYARESVGIATGITVRLHFQGNAKGEVKKQGADLPEVLRSSGGP